MAMPNNHQDRFGNVLKHKSRRTSGAKAQSGFAPVVNTTRMNDQHVSVPQIVQGGLELRALVFLPRALSMNILSMFRSAIASTCLASLWSTLETLTYRKDNEAHLYTPVVFRHVFAYTGPAASISGAAKVVAWLTFGTDPSGRKAKRT
jgi:hypothetical protein